MCVSAKTKDARSSFFFCSRTPSIRSLYFGLGWGSPVEKNRFRSCSMQRLELDRGQDDWALSIVKLFTERPSLLTIYGFRYTHLC